MTGSNRKSEIDQRAFRRALGNFATGVTIVTAQDPNGVKVGVTASSFNSLSLDPPLVLWSSIKNSRSCAVFEAASHFAVNILAFDQMNMSNHFARQQEDKFADVDWEAGLGGAPLFSNCAGRFQCETYDKVDGGDHWIFIGKVVAFDDFGRSPLCFHQGSYSMVISHPGGSSKAGEAPARGAAGERIRNHTFFLMLMAVRAYQARYQPKIEALDISLIEARSLLFLDGQPGLGVEDLSENVNSPIAELDDALANLRGRGLIARDGDCYSVTAEGQAKAAQCWSIAEAHAEEAFQSFSTEQVENFRAVLRKIIEQ